MKYLIHDFLETTAARYPDKTAFVDPDGSVTFSGLVDGARRVASALAGYCAPRTTVACCGARRMSFSSASPVCPYARASRSLPTVMSVTIMPADSR